MIMAKRRNIKGEVNRVRKSENVKSKKEGEEHGTDFGGKPSAVSQELA